MKRKITILISIVLISVFSVISGCSIINDNINVKTSNTPEVTTSSEPLSGDELIEKIAEEVKDSFD